MFRLFAGRLATGVAMCLRACSGASGRRKRVRESLPVPFGVFVFPGGGGGKGVLQRLVLSGYC